jgi:hypothetical protein
MIAADNDSQTGVESLSDLPVSSGTTYFIIVDAYSAAVPTGDFSLEISFTAQ